MKKECWNCKYLTDNGDYEDLLYYCKEGIEIGPEWIACELWEEYCDDYKPKAKAGEVKL